MLFNREGPRGSLGARALVEDFLKVREGESILLTADTGSDVGAVDAVMAAGESVGAKVIVATIPQLPFQGTISDPYIPEPLGSAAKSCDVWIDLTFPYLAGSTPYDQALKEGRLRYVLVAGLSAAGLTRIYGISDQDHLYAVQTGFDEVIAAGVGKESRIETGDGTSLSFVMAKPHRKKPRYHDKPGMYTPPGSSTYGPEIESVRGTVVLKSVFHEYYAPNTEPITIKLDGRITEMSGGGSGRYAMERSLLRAGGGKYGHIIHFTYGFHPAVRSGESLLEDIRTPGNNAIGLGIPWWKAGGGENHPDGLINRYSLWIDGELIVKDGEILSPPELAKISRELQQGRS